MYSLPIEIINHIIIFLESKEIFIIMNLNKYYKFITNNNNLWKRIYHNSYNKLLIKSDNWKISYIKRNRIKDIIVYILNLIKSSEITIYTELSNKLIFSINSNNKLNWINGNIYKDPKLFDECLWNFSRAYNSLFNGYFISHQYLINEHNAIYFRNYFITGSNYYDIAIKFSDIELFFL
jgi:hypothetical protein